MAIIFILSQLFMAAFAWFKGISDAAWSWPFRNLEPDDANWKKVQSKKAHNFSLAARTFVITGFALYAVAYFSEGGYDIALMSLAFFLLYSVWFWLVFDISFAIAIKKHWSFLGTTANTDIFVGDRGRKKAYLCTVLIFAINIVAFIFWL